MSRILIALITALTLVACSNNAQLATPNPSSQTSAVSVAMPGFITSGETTLRWRSDLIWVNDPDNIYERRADMLQQILQSEFERKGYTFVGATEQANYDVVAVALLGDLAEHEEIEQLFKLYPSLAANPAGYTKGNVLVALAYPGTNLIAWRGALEAFTDSGMAPIDVRQQRMQWAARQLLSSIPNH